MNTNNNNTIISDLYDRVRKTLVKEREIRYNYDEEGNVAGGGFPTKETFEFLLFLEVKDTDGIVLLDYPVSIAHEPMIEEVMREQLAGFTPLVKNACISIIAIENSLVKTDEWELFGLYKSPDDLIKRAFGELGRELSAAGGQQNIFDLLEDDKAKEGKFLLVDNAREVQMLRYNLEEDSVPLPLVISSIPAKKPAEAATAESNKEIPIVSFLSIEETNRKENKDPPPPSPHPYLSFNLIKI